MIGSQPFWERIALLFTPLLGGIAALWAITKFILQPAVKIAQAEERARQYQLTADSYRKRIDALLPQMADLVEKVRAQTKRTDILLLYVADRFAWERRGRVGRPPILPDEFELALYDIVSERARQGEEAAGQGAPFPPEEATE